jgi:nicotinamide-nucleotide amidase
MGAQQGWLLGAFLQFLIMQTLMPLAEDIARLLKARRETIAVAETSSGGLISAALLAVPGASAYFMGGAVPYTKQARRSVMSIADEAMQGIRSASEPYALLLARTARGNLGATWGLSETGAAGPTGNPYGDDAGHTCIALVGTAAGSEKVITLETRSADRVANMRAFASAALALLAAELKRA